MDFQENIYKIYTYEKDRRYTAKQAWQVFWNNKDGYIKTDALTPRSTIMDYIDIAKEMNIDLKYCGRYMRFQAI